MNTQPRQRTRPTAEHISTRAEYYEAERTYQHLRYTARYYRSLISEIPTAEFIHEARQPYREADRRYYAQQAAKADKEAEEILERLNDYENREAE